MFDKNLQMFVIVVEKDKSLPNTFTLNDLLKTFCGTAVSRKKRRKILIFKVAEVFFDDGSNVGFYCSDVVSAFV